MRLFITVGNRWTKLFMQLKELNGESARTSLIDLFQVLNLSWTIQTHFFHAPQGNETCAPDKIATAIRLCRSATRARSSE